MSTTSSSTNSVSTTPASNKANSKFFTSGKKPETVNTKKSSVEKSATQTKTTTTKKSSTPKRLGTMADVLKIPQSRTEPVYRDPLPLRDMGEVLPVSQNYLYQLVNAPKNASLDVISKDPSIPILVFTGTLYAEIRYLAEKLSSSEFAVLLVLHQIDEGRPHFLAYDMCMPGQTASGAGVSLMADDCDKYFRRLGDAGITQKHIAHLHSHASMGVFWSNIDDNQQLSRDDIGFLDDYRIYCVVNAKGEIKCSFVYYKPVLVRVDAAVAVSYCNEQHAEPLSAKRKKELDSWVLTQIIDTKIVDRISQPKAKSDSKAPAVTAASYMTKSDWHAAWNNRCGDNWRDTWNAEWGDAEPATNAAATDELADKDKLAASSKVTSHAQELPEATSRPNSDWYDAWCRFSTYCGIYHLLNPEFVNKCVTLACETAKMVCTETEPHLHYETLKSRALHFIAESVEIANDLEYSSLEETPDWEAYFDEGTAQKIVMRKLSDDDLVDYIKIQVTQHLYDVADEYLFA